MGSLKLHYSQLGFHKKPCISLPVNKKIGTLTITCGLRDGSRKPLRQSRVLSTEAIQAVHAMKLAKSSSKLEEVFHGRVSRLLKADLLDTLTELQRQNELELALKVYEYLCYYYLFKYFFVNFLFWVCVCLIVVNCFK